MVLMVVPFLNPPAGPHGPTSHWRHVSLPGRSCEEKSAAVRAAVGARTAAPSTPEDLSDTARKMLNYAPPGRNPAAAELQRTRRRNEGRCSASGIPPHPDVRRDLRGQVCSFITIDANTLTRNHPPRQLLLHVACQRESHDSPSSLCCPPPPLREDAALPAIRDPFDQGSKNHKQSEHSETSGSDPSSHGERSATTPSPASPTHRQGNNNLDHKANRKPARQQ